MNKSALKLDWCSNEAATYAVMRWHYSRAMPRSKLSKVGVWEHGKFIGCVIFGRGATPHLYKQYGLTQKEGCELVRVALGAHGAPVTRIMAIALKILAAKMPGLRLVLSFADPSEGHHGGIYQGGNWVYTGKSADAFYFSIKGKVIHPRSVASSGSTTIEAVRARLDPHAFKVLKPGKHRYLMPLDDDMRAQVQHLAQPYPKRAGSADSGTLGIQPRGGGATPTPALLL